MTLPWIVLTFLLFFVGMFVLVYFSMRNQDKSLEQIMQQQKALRMEFERLADALDELLEKHEVEDRDFDRRTENTSSQVNRTMNTAEMDKTSSAASSPATKPHAHAAAGIERLLLGPETKQPMPAPLFSPQSAPSSPSSGQSAVSSAHSTAGGGHSRSGGMPDLKF